jgi:hypothetical protein
MKDVMDTIERLAVRARQHQPEPLLVADDVVRRLRKPERSPLLWMAVCAIAATLLVFALVGVPYTNGDSLDAMFGAADFIQTEEGI